MDTLGLWPRTPEEMNAGWKRRGNGVGQDRRNNQALRMLMATTIGEGSQESHELLVRDFLDTQRSEILGDKTWLLWSSLSSRARTKVHSIKNSKLPGQWSLNQAALFLSACVGLSACCDPVEPDSVVKSGTGFAPSRDKNHTVCHLRAWTEIAPTMTEAELDVPILTKKLSGQQVTLTSRGLRGLAHWEWSMRNHWGKTSYQPHAIQGAPWGVVTEQEVRAATDALQVMRSVVSVKRLSSLDKLLTNMLFPLMPLMQLRPPGFRNCTIPLA